MNATQFIKDHGIKKARGVVERSASAKWADYYNISTDSVGTAGRGFSEQLCLHNNKYVLLSDIKRLVESVDLITKVGGLKDAKEEHVKWMHTPDLHTYRIGVSVERLAQAIKDYESIYGEGNE
ncbi:hypothetical protein [Acinetobacter lactucae]|uniref:hypothetical protein n=1 Tax=Acinetobacter lactucae TaxID=1785128 RepID=UPI0015802297|nr:hypothetical protein [Acinetobacter lactucae]NUG21184.1 hypothetical protein [Acinetobacter lactucae]